MNLNFLKYITPSLETQMKRWDDKETLINIVKMFGRAQIGTEIVQAEDQSITGEVLKIQVGDFMFTSPELLFEHPMQLIPLSKKQKAKAN